MEGTSFEGNLRDVPLPKILYNLYKSKETGVLKIDTGKINKSLYLSSGNLVYATSNVLSDTFGRFLLKNSRISKTIYEESLRLMIKNKKMHGEILMDMGYIGSSTELYNLLSENVKERILCLFNINDGMYIFNRNESGFQNNILHFNISTVDIIIKGINERSDIDKIKAIIDSYMDKIPSLKNLSELKKYIPINEKFISMIDGNKSIKEIIEESDLDIEYIYKLFYILIIVDMLDIKEKENNISKKDELLKEKFIDDYMNMKSKNYFEILGINADTPTDEIKKRYFSLAKDYHPDKYFNKPNEIKDIVDELFTMIAAAYNTLIDDSRRKEYVDSLKSEINRIEVDNVLNAELQFQKGKVYLNKRDYNNAVESFEWACKLNPKEGEYHAYLGWAIFKKSLPDYKQSIIGVKDLIKKGVDLNPRADKAYYFLGIIYKTENNIDLAEKEFKNALKCNPNYREALQELRVINLRKDKEKDEKKGFFKKIFK